MEFYFFWYKVSITNKVNKMDILKHQWNTHLTLKISWEVYIIKFLCVRLYGFTFGKLRLPLGLFLHYPLTNFIKDDFILYQLVYF